MFTVVAVLDADSAGDRFGYRQSPIGLSAPTRRWLGPIGGRDSSGASAFSDGPRRHFRPLMLLIYRRRIIVGYCHVAYHIAPASLISLFFCFMYKYVCGFCFHVRLHLRLKRRCIDIYTCSIKVSSWCDYYSTSSGWIQVSCGGVSNLCSFDSIRCISWCWVNWATGTGFKSGPLTWVQVSIAIKLEVKYKEESGGYANTPAYENNNRPETTIMWPLFRYFCLFFFFFFSFIFQFLWLGYNWLCLLIMLAISKKSSRIETHLCVRDKASRLGADR